MPLCFPYSHHQISSSNNHQTHPHHPPVPHSHRPSQPPTPIQQGPTTPLTPQNPMTPHRPGMSPMPHRPGQSPISPATHFPQSPSVHPSHRATPVCPPPAPPAPVGPPPPYSPAASMTSVSSYHPKAVCNPEVNSLIMNILLSDTALNIFRDHNFDSCTLCVCNDDPKVNF